MFFVYNTASQAKPFEQGTDCFYDHPQLHQISTRIQTDLATQRYRSFDRVADIGLDRRNGRSGWRGQEDIPRSRRTDH